MAFGLQEEKVMSGWLGFECWNALALNCAEETKLLIAPKKWHISQDSLPLILYYLQLVQVRGECEGVVVAQRGCCLWNLYNEVDITRIRAKVNECLVGTTKVTRMVLWGERGAAKQILLSMRALGATRIRSMVWVRQSFAGSLAGRSIGPSYQVAIGLVPAAIAGRWLIGWVQ